jgi:hypothetical protein
MGSRLLPTLLAGTVAIIINTFALKAADWVPLATAKGGLLRLLSLWLLPFLQRIASRSVVIPRIAKCRFAPFSDRLPPFGGRADGNFLCVFDRPSAAGGRSLQGAGLWSRGVAVKCLCSPPRDGRGHCRSCPSQASWYDLVRGRTHSFLCDPCIALRCS